MARRVRSLIPRMQTPEFRLKFSGSSVFLIVVYNLGKHSHLSGLSLVASSVKPVNFARK